MNWIIKTLVGAVVAGVGLKIGSDVYEAVKKEVRQFTGVGDADQTEEDGRDDDLDGAIETEVVVVRPPEEA